MIEGETREVPRRIVATGTVGRARCTTGCQRLPSKLPQVGINVAVGAGIAPRRTQAELTPFDTRQGRVAIGATGLGVGSDQRKTCPQSVIEAVGQLPETGFPVAAGAPFSVEEARRQMGSVEAPPMGIGVAHGAALPHLRSTVHGGQGAKSLGNTTESASGRVRLRLGCVARKTTLLFVRPRQGKTGPVPMVKTSMGYLGETRRVMALGARTLRSSHLARNLGQPTIEKTAVGVRVAVRALVGGAAKPPRKIRVRLLMARLTGHRQMTVTERHRGSPMVLDTE